MSKRSLIFVGLKFVEMIGVVGICLICWWLGGYGLGVHSTPDVVPNMTIEGLVIQWAMGVLLILMGVMAIYLVCVPLRLGLWWLITQNWYWADNIMRKKKWRD